jgi:mannosyltransferase OCH1-like enzyme
LIPKIIHYCWLSDDPVPADYGRCMETWKAKLPDYQFVLWDTKRFDVNSALWVKQAYETGLYACAADYIRLYAVYHNGGIYLDMDMEVVKPFDELLQKDCMFAYENHIGRNVEAGCFGAVKNHPYIQKCMEYFEKTPLFDPQLLPEITRLPKSERHDFIAPLILPEIMKNAAEEFLKKNTFNFYPRDYFTAKNVVTGKIEATENTFTIHHFAALYHSEDWRKNRTAEQKIYTAHGEKTTVKIIVALRKLFHRAKNYGFFITMRYYIGRFILRKKSVRPYKK